MISSNEMLGRIFSQNCIWPSLRQMVTILLPPSKLFIASDDICKHTEQQFVSKYHYRGSTSSYIVSRFLKRLLRAFNSSSLDLTILNDTKICTIPREDLGRKAKKKKNKKSKISYEIVINKISNKTILIPKRSKKNTREGKKEVEDSNLWRNNSKKLVEFRREIGSSRNEKK